MKAKPNFTDEELYAINRALGFYRLENQTKYQKMMSVYSKDVMDKIDKEMELIKSSQLKINNYQK